MTTLANKGGAKPLPMTVRNVGFLLDRLGQDCHPLQYLRELTQNSIEAIQRTGKPGEIVWDVDWITHDLTAESLYKLSVTDTGDGMTGDEMCQFINQLSSSASQQSFSGNYGVGAKIAAATKHPHGVIYQSWKNGEGAIIQLRRDNTGEYGLVQWLLDDGDYKYFMPVETDIKPEVIKDHGTKVVLLGQSEEENTMTPPDGAAAPSRWISKYLNTRYFIFPDGITVKAREGWEHSRSDKDRNILRTVTGEKPYLDQHCTASGVSNLSDARVLWWILKDEPAISSNSGYVESGGHMAALYQNELYDRATARAGTARLQQFGILFGARLVVIYVEPIAGDAKFLTTNTARTSLLLNGEELPWAEWAYEFRENMPKELALFVKEKAESTSDQDHTKSIRDRLKDMMDLYKVSRYRPTPAGDYLSDESSQVRVSQSNTTPSQTGERSTTDGSENQAIVGKRKGPRDGDIGNIYHLFEKKGGTPSDRVRVDPFPVVTWVSVKDDTRDVGDMEDKAAKYLADQNRLLINADFRVYEDMIKRLSKIWDDGKGIGIETIVTSVVHQWFEQALIETVIGIQQLKNSKEWGPKNIEAALSEDALTATIMQRYHVFNACRRELGAKLGKAKTAEVGA